MSTLLQTVDWAYRIAVGFAAVVLVGLALLTFVDVIGRYVLLSPVPGTVELTEALMAMIMFGALSAATQSGEHVRVELLADRMPPRFRLVLSKISQIAVLLISAAIAWSYAEHARFMVETGDMTPVLRLPIYPFTMVAFLLTLIAFLVALRVLIAPVPDGPDTGPQFNE